VANFAFQPADPGAALWQAVNSASGVAGVSRVAGAGSPGRSPTRTPPSAGLPTPPHSGHPGPILPMLDPLISTGVPSGGIVPETVSSTLIDLDHVATGAESNIPSLFSPSGVRYADGAVNLAFGDLSSSGFGMDYGVTRTWTNLTSVANGFSGSGMLIDQLPHLRQDGTTLTEVANGFNLRYYDLSGSTYTARFFVQDAFTANSTNKEYQIADPQGNLIRFNDFTVTPAYEQGAFKSFIDANGNLISVTNWTAAGKVGEVQRSNGSLIESELYSYMCPTKF
jgi:hypothetical protein